MNAFRQHVPAFVDTDHREAFPFETTDELLNNPVVQRYKHDDFSHFAIEDNTLIAVSDHGFHWWVVGFIEHPEHVNLPRWRAKYLAQMPDGSEKTLEHGEVSSSCGGWLWLRDGTKVKNLKY